jgi:anti-anti-sigma factor
MVPHGVEVRPELQVRSDVLAFGFPGERIPDTVIVSLLGAELLDHILTTAEIASAGLVVVDLRNVESLPATGFGRLLSLHNRLSQVQRKLVVLVSDPVIREVFSTTRLDRLFLVVANEAELRDLVKGVAPPAAQPAPQDGIEFTDRDLAEMDASGITLDDAIRAIEGLRR